MCGTLPWKGFWGVKGPMVNFLLCLDGSMGEEPHLGEPTLVGWCCMCQCSGEMMNRIFLYCTVAFDMWSFVFRSFGIQWVLLGVTTTGTDLTF